MPATTQRISRIIYVAGSAREFPADVQEWLSRGESRAIASPSIYDALACLSRRPRPVAILVSIEAVDWEEMEFFDQAARLSRDTTIYVTGHDHYRAKIEAALQRGARRFNIEDLNQDLSRPAPGTAPTSLDLLAGTVRSFPQAPTRQLHVSRLLDEDLPQPAAEIGQEPAEPSGNAADEPPVRLVTPADFDRDAIEPADELEPPIPFPWSPAPSRPRRTPPPSPADLPAESSTSQPAPPPAPASPPRQGPAELTSEEIAALLGRPIQPPPRSAREQIP